MKRALALLTVAAGCTLAAMQVRPDLAPGAQKPFEADTFGSGSHVRFGAYHVGAVDRSFSSESSSSRSDWLPEYLRSVDSESAHQDYQFVVEEDGAPTKRTVRCRAELARETLRSGRASMSSSHEALRCGLWLGLGDGGDGGVARLDLADGKGEVRLGERTLGIEGRDLRGRADTLEPAGYALSEGGRDLAVVQTVNGGAAWIATDLDPERRSLVATSAAALLLYRHPSP